MHYLSFIFSFFVVVSTTFAQGGDVSISDTDLSFSQSPVAAGKAFTVYATVHNNSDNDLTGVVKFFDEYIGEDIGEDVPFFMVAGASHTVFTSISLEGYGNHTLAVRVVPFDTSADKNDNNKAYKKIFVDSDMDFDGIGDSVDLDVDGDGVNNDIDVFPKNKKEWLDTDKDGIGNNEDSDDDNDNYADLQDSLPLNPLEWLDTDKDGIGDNEDTDDDNDGILDDNELLTDPKKQDTDDDGVLDKDDLFPLDTKRGRDFDKDEISDFDDRDDDNDGYEDSQDAFPFNKSEWLDTDKDGIGNNEDEDDDNDGWTDIYEQETSFTNILHVDSDKDSVRDPEDVFPLNPLEWLDTDKDGTGNNEDSDDDNDEYEDTRDAFPFNKSEWLDTDKDGIGNNEDSDDDNDGYEDTEDALPFDSTEWKDEDADGVGSNADINDNNKGPFIKLILPSIYTQKQALIFSSVDSYDEDGVIVEAFWKTSEGEEGKGEVFKTVFLQSGPHFIELTLTDDQGESRTQIFTFDVERNYSIFLVIFFGIGIAFFLLLTFKKHVFSRHELKN